MVDRVAVRAWLAALQDGLVDAIERADGVARFGRDRWERPGGGGGESRVLKDGALIEQGGVNFSEVSGASLPASATHDRPSLAGAPFSAMGVSLVLHPKNPHVPTMHLNLRFFIATPADAEPAWWFGGGFDLTPFYPVREDVLHWHRTAREACVSLPGSYDGYKAWCDRYKPLLLAHVLDRVDLPFGVQQARRFQSDAIRRALAEPVHVVRTGEHGPAVATLDRFVLDVFGAVRALLHGTAPSRLPRRSRRRRRTVTGRAA